MSHSKFKAGETQGTYVLTEPATAEEILAMANRLARARVTKGKALTSPSLTYSCLQTLLQGYEREVFAILFLVRIPAKLNSHSGQREHPDP